jgi:hypothetical protein
VVSAGMRSYYSSYYYSNRWHPHYALLEDALAETVQYIKAEMGEAIIRADAFAVLDYAAKIAATTEPKDGMLLEFGVRSGSTINHLARRHRRRTVHGFDSFEGLPERWAGYTLDEGAFGSESVPMVEPNVELHVGWFDDTLPVFLAEHAGPVALVHVDSDIYSSAKTILDNLAPRVVPGTVIVFNEYFNYPNWKQHEYRAFQEFCSTQGVTYRYLCWALYEVAVEITAVDGSPSSPIED